MTLAPFEWLLEAREHTIRCPTMYLDGWHDHEPPVFEGSGRLTLDSSAAIRFEMDATASDVGRGMLALRRCAEEADDRTSAMRLRGIDYQGREWNGGWVRPRLGEIQGGHHQLHGACLSIVTDARHDDEVAGVDPDADYKSPHVVDAFACTIGVTITPEATPKLYTLLRRSLIDAGLSTYKAKTHYKRTRPFVAANDPVICTPADAEGLAKDGSYPSGHSAFGWAWGLILAEMIPAKADAIIKRGYDFGQSRVQCGVHWQSDVDAGRVVASAAVAQLHANPEFIKAFGEAKQEVDAVLAANKPAPDCALEKEAVQ